MAKFFWVMRPRKHGGRDLVKVEIRGELPLASYFRDLDIGLGIKRRFNSIRSEDRAPLHHSYVPRPGDVVEFVPRV